MTVSSRKGNKVSRLTYHTKDDWLVEAEKDYNKDTNRLQFVSVKLFKDGELVAEGFKLTRRSS